jgi:hypothetical protein
MESRMPHAGLLVCLAAMAAPPPAEQWVVVCPAAFRDAVEPLVEHRRAQGLRVVVLPPTEGLKARLHRACRERPGRSSILLVGGLKHVPPARGTAGRMNGEPTDAAYGCLDGTRLPAVAVGRFPARDVQEVKAMVAKTLALERAGPGRWRRQMTVLAGIPAYNPVVDRLVESIAFARFDKLHPSWAGRAIYTAATSRFCLPDRELRGQALAYLREGQSVILYLGHSNAEGLYAGPTAPFLTRDDWGRLSVGPHGAVFVTFGCNGCQLAGPDGEGYGVAAMRNPAGPAAVLGSHGICFAAMVQLAADGLFQKAFTGRPPARFGDCWLAALEGVARGRIDFLSYRMLDGVDGNPNVPQATQREEHLEMFVLLGDPALRLPRVDEDVTIEVEKAVTAGKTLPIRGELPERLRGGWVSVSLERSPGSVPDGLVPLPAKPGTERDRVMRENHRVANHFVVAQTVGLPREGGYSAVLQLPERLPWPTLTLRVRVGTAKGEAMAVETLTVRRPEKTP